MARSSIFALIALVKHDLLAHILSALPDDAWEWAGRSEAPVRTIESYAQGAVEHAEEHAAQISALRTNS